MSNLIPTEESALSAWIGYLASRIATSGVGVALLDAQITELEKACADLREKAMLADAELRSEACGRTEIDPRITDSSQALLPVPKH